MPQPASKFDPALHEALKRKNFADGGTVDDDSNDNAGSPVPTKASANSDSLQSLTAPASSSGGNQSNYGGGGQQMPGQSQFGKLGDTQVPTFPKINVVSNAYSPQMRALPTPQSRQQAAAAALQPFINALAKLKGSSGVNG